MKVYKVKVNGKVYEVELEAVNEQAGSVVTEQKAAPAPVASEEGQDVVAPMQGTILDVKVKAGDAIKKGQVVAILEAMKLENEVVSPFDGVVKNVLVSKGQKVNNGEKLLIIG